MVGVLERVTVLGSDPAAGRLSARPHRQPSWKWTAAGWENATPRHQEKAPPKWGFEVLKEYSGMNTEAVTSRQTLLNLEDPVVRVPDTIGRAFLFRSRSKALLTELVQDALTQEIGIALTGFRKFDDPLGYSRLSKITSGKPKGYANRFECDAHYARRLGIEPPTVQK